MTTREKWDVLLKLCMLARRSPDKFLRRGTHWLTVYEFFVCEHTLIELPAIKAADAEAFALRYPWRAEQIYDGLKSPDTEGVEYT